MSAPTPDAKTIQQLCQDWAEEHSCAQRLALSLGVPKTEVYGDNYGVPGILCLLGMIRERVAQPMATHRRAAEWHGLTDDGLRLRLGELTAQEIRTVRAVLNAIVAEETVNAEVSDRLAHATEIKQDANGGSLH